MAAKASAADALLVRAAQSSRSARLGTVELRSPASAQSKAALQSNLLVEIAMPDALLLRVFFHLCLAADIMASALVCRQWARVAGSPDLWFSLFFRKYGTSSPRRLGPPDWRRQFISEALARRQIFAQRGVARPAFVANAKQVAATTAFTVMADYRRVWDRLHARIVLVMRDSHGNETCIIPTQQCVFDTALHVQWSFDRPELLRALANATELQIRARAAVFAWEAASVGKLSSAAVSKPGAPTSASKLPSSKGVVRVAAASPTAKGAGVPSKGAFVAKVASTAQSKGVFVAKVASTAQSKGAFVAKVASTAQSALPLKSTAAAIGAGGAFCGAMSGCLLAATPCRTFPGKLIAGDRHVVLHAQPLTNGGQLITGAFAKRGDCSNAIENTAFIAWEAPFGAIFPRVFYGSSAHIHPPNRPLIPASCDVDPLFGLHGFSVRLTMRSFDRDLYAFEFADVGATPRVPPCITSHNGVPGLLVPLLKPGTRTHLLSIADPLALPWVAGAMTQSLESVLACDVQVADEFGNLFACGCDIVPLERAPETYLDFAHAGVCYRMAWAVTSSTARVDLSAAVVDDTEQQLRFLFSAEVWLALPDIDAWFGTRHADKHRR